MRPLRILTWHVHGSYLYYLVQSPHDFYLTVKPGKPEGYGGRSGSFPWPGNTHDVPTDQVRDLDFDFLGMHEVLGCNPKAGRGHLLDFVV